MVTGLWANSNYDTEDDLRTGMLDRIAARMEAAKFQLYDQEVPPEITARFGVEEEEMQGSGTGPMRSEHINDGEISADDPFFASIRVPIVDHDDPHQAAVIAAFKRETRHSGSDQHIIMDGFVPTVDQD